MLNLTIANTCKANQTQQVQKLRIWLWNNFLVDCRLSDCANINVNTTTGAGKGTELTNPQNGGNIWRRYKIACFTVNRPRSRKGLSWSSFPDSGTVKCSNLPNLSALSRDAWPATSLLTLCSIFYNRTEIHCNATPRQIRSIVVEAHFRDADNNQHRSFQGWETLPLIEDSFVRVFRVKVQAAAVDNPEGFLLANWFLFPPSRKTHHINISSGWEYKLHFDLRRTGNSISLLSFKDCLDIDNLRSLGWCTIQITDTWNIEVNFGFYIFKAGKVVSWSTFPLIEKRVTVSAGARRVGQTSFS